jgi:hypothetical protein
VGGVLVGVGLGAPAIFAFAGAVSFAAAVAVLAMGWFVVGNPAGPPAALPVDSPLAGPGGV